MAQTASRELLKPSDVWFKNMAVIVATLQDNPWWAPLMAAWTPENAIRNTELANKVEWRQENEQRWLVWRHYLRQHLQEWREYTNDCAPDRIPQLERSRLWRMAHLPDSDTGFCERRSYSKSQCLADLQNMTDLVKPPKPRPDYKRHQRLRNQLRAAIQNAGHDQGSAAKEMGINRDTLQDFLNNKKNISPQEATLRKMQDYVEKHSARSDK